MIGIICGVIITLALITMNTFVSVDFQLGRYPE